MRYLIISDLHANLEALEAVLRDGAGATSRRICCGDLVGYGADPNAVTDWVRENCSIVVRGNHDRASTGQDDLEWFNPVARPGRDLDAGEPVARQCAITSGAAARPDQRGFLPGGARVAIRRGRVRGGGRRSRPGIRLPGVLA